MQTERIRAAYERNAKAMQRKPGVAQDTETVTCRIIDGLRCEVTDGIHTVTADEPESYGGTDAGPTPGFFIRGGLASCFAISVMMRAAVGGVPVDALEVTVESDHDMRGAFGLADVPKGFTAVRVRVTIQSSAPEAAVRKVIDEADDFSPMLAFAREPHGVAREVTIVPTVP